MSSLRLPAVRSGARPRASRMRSDIYRLPFQRATARFRFAKKSNKREPRLQQRPISAASKNHADFPDLPLFKQLATDLASLDKALVKIHESRQTGSGQVDESLLTTLIEEVQREQEAWFKQVQVMERLVEQAETLETSKTELEALREQYEEMRRKVDLYNGLLAEREREVDDLKQQLEDVNTAAELKERKNVALQEFVVSGTTTAQEEMGLPTWSPSEVSTFFVKKETDATDSDEEEAAKQEKIYMSELKTYPKKLEVPGLAFVSIFLALTRVTGGVWDSTTTHLPREIKALIEISGLGLILITAACVASSGFM